jgi:hypothetical protein
MREIFLLLIVESSFRIDDQSRIQKRIRHFYRLTEESTGIVTQIQHESRKFPTFLGHLRQGILEISAGAVLKLP